jgi:hypothetical protein
MLRANTWRLLLLKASGHAQAVRGQLHRIHTNDTLRVTMRELNLLSADLWTVSPYRPLQWPLVSFCSLLAAKIGRASKATSSACSSGTAMQSPTRASLGPARGQHAWI